VHNGGVGRGEAESERIVQRLLKAGTLAGENSSGFELVSPMHAGLRFAPSWQDRKRDGCEANWFAALDVGQRGFLDEGRASLAQKMRADGEGSVRGKVADLKAESEGGDPTRENLPDRGLAADDVDHCRCDTHTKSPRRIGQFGNDGEQDL